MDKKQYIMYIIISYTIANGGKVKSIPYLEITDNPEKTRKRLAINHQVDSMRIHLERHEFSNDEPLCLQNILELFYNIDDLFHKSRHTKYILARMSYIYLLSHLGKSRYKIHCENASRGFSWSNINHHIEGVKNLKGWKGDSRFSQLRSNIAVLLNHLKHLTDEWKEQSYSNR